MLQYYSFIKPYISDLLSTDNLLTVIKWGTILSPLFYFIQTYVFGDYTFFVFFLVLFVMDIVSGGLKHFWKVHDFSFTQLGMKAFLKFAVCSIALVTFNVMSKTLDTPDQIDDVINIYLFALGKTIVVVFVGGSVFENLYAITNGKFPPIGWLNRIKKFNESVDIKDLTRDNNETKTNN